MKRITVFAALAITAINLFAAGYYGDYSYSSPKFEMPGWLVFMAIIMIAWGILEIILFFKIWGMTNDIREMKNDYFNEKKYETQGQMKESLRKNLVLGDIEKVKKTLLKEFIDDVESAFAKMKSSDYVKDENGAYQLTSYKEKNLKESIRPYVEKLQKQFELLGEELPVYINRMETYKDYYSLFAEEENVVKKPDQPTEKETLSSFTNPVISNNLDSEKKEDNDEQATDTKSSSNKSLYFVTIPIIATLAFLVGVAVFHANYSYSDWWVEESNILIPAFIVYAAILGIYYAIVNNMKKKA